MLDLIFPKWTKGQGSIEYRQTVTIKCNRIKSRLINYSADSFIFFGITAAFKGIRKVSQKVVPLLKVENT